jgi:hypothetical protein
MSQKKGPEQRGFALGLVGNGIPVPTKKDTIISPLYCRTWICKRTGVLQYERNMLYLTRR